MALLKDPICGRSVAGQATAPQAEYKQRTYYFCSDSCRARFELAAQRVKLQEAAKIGALFSAGKVRWGVA